MRRLIGLALVVCFIVTGVALAADYYAGVKLTASGTSDFKVPFSGSDSELYAPDKVTVKAPDAAIQVSFWHYDGSTWSRLIPDAALGDTMFPLEAGDILNQEFPIKGRYPHALIVNRTGATSVNSYWK